MRLQVLATAVAIAGGLVVGGAAYATDACSSGHVCIYGNQSFEFKIGDRTGGQGLATLTGTYNNNLDSYKNLSSSNAAAYDESNGSGDCINIRSATNDPNLAIFNQDSSSSWRTNHGC